MDFMTAVRTCFQKYANISGRAPRSEYWWFALFMVIASFVLGIIDGLIFGMGPGNVGILGLIFSLGTLLPSICVGGRRLHDVGRSAWWMLLIFIPIVGWLVLLWWAIQPGTPGTNDFGPNPLGA